MFSLKYLTNRLNKNILFRTFCTPHKMELIKESNKTPEIITICNDDLSFYTNFPNGFNVASFVNKSDTLQKLLKLNVNLSKIEKKPYVMRKLLQLNFEKDMKDHIVFLAEYISNDDLGYLITKNPEIFTVSLDDLNVRINYLLSKQFNENQIKCIIARNPFWLMFR